jgi:YVTN family beta-propeller protein
MRFGHFGLIAACVSFSCSAQGFAQNAFITNSDSDTVSVIDIQTNKVIATIPVGVSPDGVAVTSDYRKVYVANFNEPGTVSVIDTATNAVTATIPVGFFPFGVAATPDGRKVYVNNSGSIPNSVSVIDTATNVVIATITVGSAGGSDVSPGGRNVYVADSTSGNVSGDRNGKQQGDRCDPRRWDPGWCGGDPGRPQGLCYG